MTMNEYCSFMRYASHFFLKEGRMYQKTLEDGMAHRLVVDKVHWMYMMQATVGQHCGSSGQELSAQELMGQGGAATAQRNVASVAVLGVGELNLGGAS